MSLEVPSFLILAASVDRADLAATMEQARGRWSPDPLVSLSSVATSRPSMPRQAQPNSGSHLGRQSPPVGRAPSDSKHKSATHSIFRRGPIGVVVVAILAGAAIAWLRRDSQVTLSLPEPIQAPLFSQESLDGACAAYDSVAQRIAVELPAARDRVPHQDGAGDSSEPDEEWVSVPRKTRPSAATVLLTYPAKAIVVSSLFRHGDLNPRDIHIAKDRRVAFEQMVAPMLSGILEMDVAYSDVVTQEMNRLIALGVKKPLTFNDSEYTRKYLSDHPSLASPPHDKRLYCGGDSIRVFYGVGGTLYGFSLSDSPSVRMLDESRKSHRLAFAEAVVSKFRDFGTISGYEHSQILQEAIQVAEELTR